MNKTTAKDLCVGQNLGMKSAHQSKSIRRGAGAESPTFDFYSATGAEKLKWASNSTGNGVSLMIFGVLRGPEFGGESVNIRMK